MGWTMIVLLGALAVGQAGAVGEANVPRVRAGAYYFDGWTGQTFHITERLTTEFADREPVWGWKDDTDAIMRRQIDLAADHGLKFFAFCWYRPEGPDKATPLNNALQLYLRAPNRERLEFCLLVANHGGYRIGPDDWDAVSADWIELFKQPTYLEQGGQPLLIFFSPRELVQAFGSPAAVKEAFERLRTRARAAGLPGVRIAACATPGPEHGWNDLKQLEQAGFDLLTGYNYAGVGAGGPERRRPFAELVAGSEGIWDAFATKTTLPYAPVVTVGWDKRPWEKPDAPPAQQSVYYEGRSPEVVGEFVARAVGWVERNPAHATADRLILLYAWNENGEGGYLTPTRRDGTAYLEAVRGAIGAPAR